MKTKPLITLALISACFVAWAGPKDDAAKAIQEKDYGTAFQIRLKPADTGDVDELGNIGNMYAFGQGVEQSYDKAYEYWRKAADKHLGTAMGNIAVLYMTGKGPLQQSDSDAAKWYLRAAEHRHWPSMITLSSLYMLGRGFEKNKVEALAWAGLAASNAPSEQAKQMSIEQVRKMATEVSKEELGLAQQRSDVLRGEIDKNVKLYVNQ